MCRVIFPVVFLSMTSELPVSIFCSLSTELKWNAPVAQKQRCSAAAGFTSNQSGMCQAGTGAALSLSTLPLILAVPYPMYLLP